MGEGRILEASLRGMTIERCGQSLRSRRYCAWTTRNGMPTTMPLAERERGQTRQDADLPSVSCPGELTIIERRAGWQVVDVRELWRYRELLFFLTWRDIKVR